MQEFTKIKGLLVAPFTPYKDAEAEEINTEIISDYARMLRSNGLKGVFINGSSGEGYMLTKEERMRLAEAWREAIPEGEDFKLLVHVGSTSIKESRELARHAQEIGAFGIGAMASPFPKVSRVEDLAAYCREIAKGAPELPFYYYHIPAFNGAFLPMPDFLKVMEREVPTFAGLKYTYESNYEYNQCMLYKDGKYDMLYGLDETILCALAMGGAKGGISGTGNYIGRVLNEVLACWDKGDIEGARRAQNYAQDVINVIARYRGNIVAGKRIMKLIGLDLGPNRIPFHTIEPEEEQAIRSALEAIDFFSHCNRL